ncbi:MAG TPA: hypothetical protein VMR28_00465 [Candidatus Saccharimonadales bacterium]|nr:hypothetical protein [Candidatus Saccharimonadales bacterium]
MQLQKKLLRKLKGFRKGNKRLILGLHPLEIIIIIVVLVGGGVGVIYKDTDFISNHSAKVKSAVKSDASSPPKQAAATTSSPKQTTSSSTVNTSTPAQDSSTTPNTAQSDAITKCEAGEQLTQGIETGDYNVGISSIRDNGISVVDSDINELQTLIAGLSTDPPSTTQQDVNNELNAIQNVIAYWNGQISQENNQITQQQDISAGDLATNCPSLTLIAEHQLVPALPGYTEGSPWNP